MFPFFYITTFGDQIFCDRSDIIHRGKECIVTNRFLWHGGIQKKMSWQLSQGTQLQCLYCCTMISVISEKRLCVAFVVHL